MEFIFCLIWFFTSHQQSFSYIRTGLSGLNHYWARINVSCSRTTTQWPRWGSNPWPFGLVSSTLPLSSNSSFDPYPANLFVQKMPFAYYICCTYSNALKKISSQKQTLWTLIRLLLREQSDLGPYCLHYKMSSAYHICCTYSNALQKISLQKQTIWTLIRLLLRVHIVCILGFQSV